MWYIHNMALMTQPERVNIVHELDTQFPLIKDNFDPRQTSLEELPTPLLEDIIQRLEDARFIARVQLLCKEFRDAGNKVRSLRFVVLEMYHERARDNAVDVPSVPRIRDPIPDLESSNGQSRSLTEKRSFSFQSILEQILKPKVNIVQLRVEVEHNLQAKTVPDDERRRTDFWLTDPRFLRQWLPGMGSTLQHLCIVDYGQQDITHRSTIIKTLSESCKQLKSLELRNMYIDTSDCEEMPMMTSLTLRSVKVDGEALQHINDKMFKLQTLALLGVFGAQRGNLTFEDISAIYLGLSTPANIIEMNLPKVQKLQIKTQCPRQLIITAPALKYVAINVDGPSRWGCQVDDGSIRLQYRASSFITLSSSAEKNPNMEKIFKCNPYGRLGEDGRLMSDPEHVPSETLGIASCSEYTLDVPCMKLVRDGRYLDLLDDTPANIPSFTKLHECEHSEAADTPPGLWTTKGNIQIDGLNLEISEGVLWTR